MRKPSLAQCVLTRIQEDITRGNIKDGEIITERILEQRYGVSRTPIKEALKLLEAEGWVEITPRQETRVIPFGIAEIQETLSIRIAMEGIAIKLCMQHMNDDLRLEFGQLLRELEDLGEKIDAAAPDTLDVYNGLDNMVPQHVVPLQREQNTPRLSQQSPFLVQENILQYPARHPTHSQWFR